MRTDNFELGGNLKKVSHFSTELLAQTIELLEQWCQGVLLTLQSRQRLLHSDELRLQTRTLGVQDNVLGTCQPFK